MLRNKVCKRIGEVLGTSLFKKKKDMIPENYKKNANEKRVNEKKWNHTKLQLIWQFCERSTS